MTKLPTLKDLETEGEFYCKKCGDKTVYDGCCPNPSSCSAPLGETKLKELVKKEDLKQMAIAWYRFHDERAKMFLRKGNNEAAATNRSAACAIKVIFNTPDKDLDQEDLIDEKLKSDASLEAKETEAQDYADAMREDQKLDAKLEEKGD